MKMKKFIILSICALGALACGLTACGDDGPDELTKYVGGMRTSADAAVSVETKVELVDGENTVYTFIRNMSIDTASHSATVTDTKTTLSNNFEFVTTTSTSSAQDVTGKTLIGLNLSNKLVADYSIKDGDLVCKVSKNNISKVLASTVSASSDMELVIDFEDGNLVKAEYSYINTSSRTVNVTVTYGY